MNAEIKQLFERVAELTGYPTSSERNPQGHKDYYKNSYLIMDHNSIYGGDVFMIVLKSTGETAF
uniref:Uncharacterized protein n=1 Tax=viral metagenome TaxID=1070528 RepID=A0A6M3Y5R4_9ZZZZ